MSVLKTFTLALAMAFAGAISAEAQSLNVGIPTQGMLSRLGLERAWWSQATLDPQRDVVQFLTLDEDNVYVQANSGLMTAFDAETGKKRWANQIGRTDQPSYRAASNDRFVLVLSGSTLYCIEKFRGQMFWRIPIPRPPSTGPMLDEKQVYIGCRDGSLYAFDLRETRNLYESNQLPDFAGEPINWVFKTGAAIPFPPASSGRVLNFASLDRSLYAIGRDQRELLWQFETDRPATAPLAITDGVLLLATGERLFCLGSEKGQVRWPFTVRFPIRQQPRIIGDDVFVVSDRGGFYCLSLETGNAKWPWKPDLTQFVAATATRVIAADDTGNLIVFSRQNGAVQGTLPLRGFTTRISNDRNDRVYLATPSGLVMCLREIGAEFPLYHMYPERSPLLPEFAPATEQPADSSEG